VEGNCTKSWARDLCKKPSLMFKFLVQLDLYKILAQVSWQCIVSIRRTSPSMIVLIEGCSARNEVRCPVRVKRMWQETAELESSYEERWEDMLSILDLQSVLEGDSVSEVDADWQWHNTSSSASSSSSLAVMHNVSMAQSVASSSTILVPSGENFAVFYIISLYVQSLQQLHWPKE